MHIDSFENDMILKKFPLLMSSHYIMKFLFDFLRIDERKNRVEYFQNNIF